MTHEITHSHHFDKSYKSLSDLDKKHVKKTLVELADDPHYPALRTKHLHAESGMFESSANMDIRLIWHYRDEKTIEVLDVGHHDILRRFDHSHYLG